MAEIKEECGVFGIYDLDGNDVTSSIYYGLTSLQHRGQEACGLAVSDTNHSKPSPALAVRLPVHQTKPTPADESH